MKKMLMVVGVLISSLAVQAQMSAKVTVATNYICRGVSFYNGGSQYASAGTPVVQGQMDYKVGDLSASVFTSGVESVNLGTFGLEKDTEVDYFLNYNKAVNKDWSLGVSVGHYSFLRNEDNATTMLSANVMWSFIRVDVGQTSNYSGLQTSLTYSNLSLWIPVSEKLLLTPAVGRSDWGDDTKVGMSDYTDYKVGVKMLVSPKTEVDLAYTNTSGRKDLVFTNEDIKTDKAVTASVTMNFDL